LKVGLLVPNLNDAGFLECLLRETPDDWIKIVMDGGSVDGSVDLARSYGVPVYAMNGHDFGLNLRLGLQLIACNYDVDVVAHCDADHSPEAVQLVVEKLGELDVVVGRELKSASGWHSLTRKVTRWLVVHFLGLNNVDHPTCGLRVWKKGALAKLPWYRMKAKDFAVQIETLFWAERMGLRIGECEFVGHQKHRGVGLVTILKWIQTFMRLCWTRFWGAGL